MADDKPIIIIQKKGGHGGHHGGAWKIAYADFVTAMMAFFMVMWLVNSASVQTRTSIASYFRKPGIFSEGSGTPLMMGASGILDDAFIPPRPEEKRPKKVKEHNPNPVVPKEQGTGMDKKYVDKEGDSDGNKGRGPDQTKGFATKEKELQDQRFNSKATRKANDVAEQIQKLAGMPELKEALGKIETKVEDGALVLEIMDTEKTSMFNSGSPVIRDEAVEAFRQVADALAKFEYPIEVIGHTDAKGFGSSRGTYTNWELSADRANAATRILEREGIKGSRFASVTGKAASDLKKPEEPFAPSNRRITLKMDFKKEGPEPDPNTAKKIDELFTQPQATVGDESIDLSEIVETPHPTAVPTARPTLVPDEPSIPGAIKLPNTAPPTGNPEFMEKDKIFSNSPVVGPRELFSGM